MMLHNALITIIDHANANTVVKGQEVCFMYHGKARRGVVDNNKEKILTIAFEENGVPRFKSFLHCKMGS